MHDLTVLQLVCSRAVCMFFLLHQMPGRIHCGVLCLSGACLCPRPRTSHKSGWLKYIYSPQPSIIMLIHMISAPKVCLEHLRNDLALGGTLSLNIHAVEFLWLSLVANACSSSTSRVSNVDWPVSVAASRDSNRACHCSHIAFTIITSNVA